MTPLTSFIKEACSSKNYSNTRTKTTSMSSSISCRQIVRCQWMKHLCNLTIFVFSLKLNSSIFRSIHLTVCFTINSNPQIIVKSCLANFRLKFSFYTTDNIWKHCFIFPGGIEKEHWSETGRSNWNKILIKLKYNVFTKKLNGTY